MVELSADFCVEDAPRVVSEIDLFLVEAKHLLGIYPALPPLELDHAVLDGLPLDPFLVADRPFKNGQVLLQFIFGLW